MPEIDPRSAVLFAAGSVVIALVLCLALRRHRRGDGAIFWLIGSNVLLFGAAVGVLLRPVVGFEMSSLMVIMCAYAGICCAYFALLRAEAIELPWRPLLAIGIAATAVQSVIALRADTVVDLMLSSSVLNSALTGYMARQAWRHARRHGAAIATLLALPFAALFVAYAARLGVIAIWGKGGAAVTASLLIIVVMAWAAVILELGLIALRESQARIRLRSALLRAEAAAEARTRFLLSVSHELRTPLNAISGLSALMHAEVSGPLPEGYRPHIEQIRSNAEDLTDLVTTLLDHASATDLPADPAWEIAIRMADSVHRKFDCDPAAAPRRPAA